MYILGLTGSIAMGKTWAGKCFRHFGVPVHDADACVHEVMKPGGSAVAAIADRFGDVKNSQGGIDRQKLAAIVFADPAALQTLEGIVHPLVRTSQWRFLAANSRAGRTLVALDIPLLFETGAQNRVDATVVVSAPPFVQRRRALRRAGMDEEKLAAILARQTPDALKRQLADFVVATSGPKAQSLRTIGQIVKVTKPLPGYAWGPHWPC